MNKTRACIKLYGKRLRCIWGLSTLYALFHSFNNALKSQTSLNLWLWKSQLLIKKKKGTLRDQKYWKESNMSESSLTFIWPLLINFSKSSMFELQFAFAFWKIACWLLFIFFFLVLSACVYHITLRFLDSCRFAWESSSFGN